MACPGDCYPLIASHLAVPVVQYTTTTGRDFALEPAGSIMGLVTEAQRGPRCSRHASTSTPVRQGGSWSSRRSSPMRPVSHTVPNLSAGTYWAMGFASNRLRAQVFENIPCPEPDCGSGFVATGTPIVVEPPTPCSSCS